MQGTDSYDRIAAIKVSTAASACAAEALGDEWMPSHPVQEAARASVGTGDRNGTQGCVDRYPTHQIAAPTMATSTRHQTTSSRQLHSDLRLLGVSPGWVMTTLRQAFTPRDNTTPIDLFPARRKMFVVSTHINREIYINDVVGSRLVGRILLRRWPPMFVQHAPAKIFDIPSRCRSMIEGALYWRRCNR
jgi:hypothetical protein